jgi:catechol 2,3-dioxygenase-like lactoylglutathione lyase family enzyme
MIMASPVKLSHVVLYSRQVPAMRDWYVEVLESRVVYETPGVAFLTYDDEHHRVAIADPSVMSESGASEVLGEGRADLAPERLAGLPPHGLAHIAFTYASLGELLENWERLNTVGIAPVATVNHGPTTSMYYADPDGNQLELQIDNFATAADSTAFIQSKSFARNPYGQPFEPGSLLSELRAGRAEAELTVPTW